VEEFDVHTVLSSLVDLYSGNQKLELVWNKADAPAIIQADRTQVNRLFTNLLQNAIEASVGKEIIKVRIDEKIEVNRLLISVTDEGMGIPLEKQDKIFTPNFTTKSSGTGLGLAICKGIVERANGKIWFETVEGTGTTFNVLLPLINLPG
jgi:signal transduction histidine kinase